MQETFDFYTLIIIITFLGTLLFLAFFINKKKDFFKSKINKNRSIDIIGSSLLGGGNRVIMFRVNKNISCQIGFIRCNVLGHLHWTRFRVLGSI